MSKLSTLGKSAVTICSISLVIANVVIHQNKPRTSQQGLELIANAEGCLATPYQCSADVLTVGIGSTSASGRTIDPNKKYTVEEITDRFIEDLKDAERCVIRHANGENMPQQAFDALVSITFNVGCGSLRRSSLFSLAKQGYSEQMCDQFNRWIYSNGKVLQGLVVRRQKEKELCLNAKL